MKSIPRALSDRRGSLAGRIRQAGVLVTVVGGHCVALSPAVRTGPGYIECAVLGMALSAFPLWVALSYGRHAGMAT